jgi:hypothetical protein
VPPKNIGPLLELLEGAFSEPDKPFKVTLSETVFSDNDVTHQLTVSSADVNAISALMSNQREQGKVHVGSLSVGGNRIQLYGSEDLYLEYSRKRF